MNGPFAGNDATSALYRSAAYAYWVFAGLLTLSVLLQEDWQALGIALAATAVLLAAGRPLLAPAQRIARSLAHRPVLVVWLAGLAVLVLNAALGLLVHLPVPAIRDEFSYLLAADTFSAGRLTNPTHPMWQHFDSGHIIHEPTYQSKYPPGQGLMLALGQAIFGHPIAGVWISLAAASAATAWMLQAWLPMRWALLATLLLVVNFQLFSLWGQSYWGGAATMLGGALLFGGLRHVARTPSTRHAVILGAGVVVLACTRPYEGLLASIPAAVAVLVRWRRSDRRARFAGRVMLPALLVMLLGFCWLGYYNYRVTGDPLRMPYQVWLEQQNKPLPNALLPLAPVDDRVVGDAATGAADDAGNAALLRELENQRFERRPWAKLARQYRFYVGAVFAIPFMLLPFVARRPWGLFAIATWLLVLAGIMLNRAAGFPHYAAPIAGLFLVALTQGLRQLRLWRPRGLHAGRWLVRATPAFALGVMLVSLVNWIDRPVMDFHAWGLRRAGIAQELRRAGGRHLVVVRYSAAHPWYREWVYNEADIDGSGIVWAKELSDRENRELLEYFAGRRVWLLEADGNQPLKPYPQAAPRR